MSGNGESESEGDGDADSDADSDSDRRQHVMTVTAAAERQRGGPVSVAGRTTYPIIIRTKPHYVKTPHGAESLRRFAWERSISREQHSVEHEVACAEADKEEQRCENKEVKLPSAYKMMPLSKPPKDDHEELRGEKECESRGEDAEYECDAPEKFKERRKRPPECPGPEAHASESL